MNSTSTPPPQLLFPDAQQAQIIRANQRDLYHISTLKEQAENVLRSWLGTRWLSRWDKEVDLITKFMYYGLTTGRAVQTLGEEYTDIWQYSSLTKTLPPAPLIRIFLIISSSLPVYILGRWGQNATTIRNHPKLAVWLRRLPSALEIASEINLAIFYLRGTYYDLAKRLLGIRQVTSIPQNPQIRPPSYSLLGVMIAIRLLHRLITFVRESYTERDTPGKHSNVQGVNSQFLDDRSIASLLDAHPESEVAKSAEEDEGTAIDVTSISPSIRASRSCTLCLEERTDSCATECGHLFCWNCIMGWGREKAECPLCRQSLSLDKLLPIYNL
ncbi:hypothetical protein CVT24_003531 [Panaeolus cyanescens]|uniref:RING-type E3 ubiquitin transferase n=1 Tax=Panaeolus cyanescens TaxID=181874 RepID=A0A409Y7B9_9AGAR|nr:hypothetical protein CVT24_003531 [Panaeolus cyanescens]